MSRLGYMARVARTVAGHPLESWDRAGGRLEIMRFSPAAGLVPLAVDPGWEEHLHVAVDADWPCVYSAEFETLWTDVGRELALLGAGHDADPNLARTAFCAVRHLGASKVVETGVARGITSRMV